MAEVMWQLVNVKQMPRMVSEAFARVGQGNIALSAAACRMIEGVYDYSFVEIHCGSVNNTAVKIGVRFIKTKTPNCLKFYQRKYKGKLTDGINIRSKALILEFFGKSKENITTRYPVEKIDYNMLAIDITKEF